MPLLPTKIADHTLRRLWSRCGIAADKKELVSLCQKAEKLYSAPNGDYWLICQSVPAKITDKAFAVVVAKGREIVTAVTLRMAYSNCQKAVFSVLLHRGELAIALALRADPNLPPPRGTDDRTYKYSRKRAELIWNAFSWIK